MKSETTPWPPHGWSPESRVDSRGVGIFATTGVDGVEESGTVKEGGVWSLGAGPAYPFQGSTWGTAGAGVTLGERAVLASQKLEVKALFVRKLEKDLLPLGIFEALPVPLEEAM